ncbi:MAG: Abi family protein [Cyclobacteriaceae bacterium]
MKFEKVRLFVSAPRLDRYLLAVANKKTRAVRLYKANLKISQAFLPVLAILEVAIRNRLNTILTAHFSDPDWITNQKNAFMIDPRLRRFDQRTRRQIPNHTLRQQVEKAERKLRSARVTITSGKVISEQTFGFWTEFFERSHYRILLGRPIQIFANLPPRHGRQIAYETLNNIRLFRNRLYHNEPICFNGNAIDFQKAEDIYDAIRDVYSWLDPELLRWIGDVDTVTKKINSAKQI